MTNHTYTQVCEECGGGLCELHDQIRDIPDPGEPREYPTTPDPQEESKLAKAYLQVIQADARAEQWGKSVKMYRDQGCTCGERGVCAYCRDIKVKT